MAEMLIWNKTIKEASVTLTGDRGFFLIISCAYIRTNYPENQ